MVVFAAIRLLFYSVGQGQLAFHTLNPRDKDDTGQWHSLEFTSLLLPSEVSFFIPRVKSIDFVAYSWVFGRLGFIVKKALQALWGKHLILVVCLAVQVSLLTSPGIYSKNSKSLTWNSVPFIIRFAPSSSFIFPPSILCGHISHFSNIAVHLTSQCIYASPNSVSEKSESPSLCQMSIWQTAT